MPRKKETDKTDKLLQQILKDARELAEYDTCALGGVLARMEFRIEALNLSPETREYALKKLSEIL